MKYTIGIDLGTSNSAVAVAGIPERGAPRIEVVPVTQMSGPGAAVEMPLLPSVLYLSHAQEFSPGALDLPWEAGKNRSDTIGALARERGALVPDRVVTSAKSWLCSAAIDRRAPVLPWTAAEDIRKLSPVEVSTRILEHLRIAAENHLKTLGEDGFTNVERVILTVPASFDETARALTVEAAHAAGWPALSLLEEPQAAFYAWLAQHEQSWRKEVRPGDIVLVCDVGGGTADFSLIAVTEEDGALGLERVSVGDHILLGGDNMDLALAHTVRHQLEAAGTQLDTWQFLALTHAARGAKESLLAQEAPEEVTIGIPSRSSRLFASSISARLSAETARSVLIDGFFPMVPADSNPAQRRGAGLQELGLNFASDAAVTKHLARFLRRSLENVRSDERLRGRIEASQRPDATMLEPTAVLFNGGVFRSPLLRARVLGLLESWQGHGTVRELAGADLDLAVGRGAACFGAIGRDAVRIRAGLSRSYYLGLESNLPAVPGIEPPVKGLCIAPQGVEEGTRFEVPGREFGLVTGEEVEFRLFSSPVRAGDELGTLIDDAVRELEESTGLVVTLPASRDLGEVVPVRLSGSLTDVGTLELFFHDARSPDRRWQLEFGVRPLERT